MYAISMLALFRLRRSEPALARPFRAPYPLAPIWTLAGVAVCLASIIYYNKIVSVLFCALLLMGYLLIRVAKRAAVSREATTDV